MLNLLLLVVITIQIVLRYLFNAGGVRLEELQWQIYGVMLITSMSYALVKDAHVRLDQFSAKYPDKIREIVEIFGLVFLLLPCLVVIFTHSLIFFQHSLAINESSSAPTGLPMLWIFKAFLPLGVFLYGLAAISRTIKGIARLKHTEGEEQ